MVRRRRHHAAPTVGRWRSGWLSNVLVGTALLAMVAAPIAYLVV